MTDGSNGRVRASLQEALTIAVSAIKRGELQQGQKALRWILEQDPSNTSAWLWLACCLDDDEAKAECYRRVSAITGEN
ncbi:MAG: hypothetical protein GTO14_03235 [Anaerolineales bacterium]|nr:hypothetical protein [Anaerolineales bacterium]